jgi:hypothetical protein
MGLGDVHRPSCHRGLCGGHRPVNGAERAKLAAAIAAAGCSGGKLEFDDGHFEANDVICSDGKKYDLKFDDAFKLVQQKLED